MKGKPQKALKIFAFIIKGLKDDFTTRLAEQITVGEGAVDDDIHWVITVPAIWDEKAKQFMREAARQVSLSDTLYLTLQVIVHVFLKRTFLKTRDHFLKTDF